MTGLIVCLGIHYSWTEWTNCPSHCVHMYPLHFKKRTKKCLDGMYERGCFDMNEEKPCNWMWDPKVKLCNPDLYLNPHIDKFPYQNGPLKSGALINNLN